MTNFNYIVFSVTIFGLSWSLAAMQLTDYEPVMEHIEFLDAYKQSEDQKNKFFRTNFARVPIGAIPRTVANKNRALLLAIQQEKSDRGAFAIIPFFPKDLQKKILIGEVAHFGYIIPFS